MPDFPRYPKPTNLGATDGDTPPRLRGGKRPTPPRPPYECSGNCGHTDANHTSEGTCQRPGCSCGH